MTVLKYHVQKLMHVAILCPDVAAAAFEKIPLFFDPVVFCLQSRILFYVV